MIALIAQLTGISADFIVLVFSFRRTTTVAYQAQAASESQAASASSSVSSTSSSGVLSGLNTQLAASGYTGTTPSGVTSTAPLVTSNAHAAKAASGGGGGGDTNWVLYVIIGSVALVVAGAIAAVIFVKCKKTRSVQGPVGVVVDNQPPTMQMQKVDTEPEPTQSHNPLNTTPDDMEIVTLRTTMDAPLYSQTMKEDQRV